MPPGSNDRIAFDEYLNALEYLPNSQAALILQNTHMGIAHYLEYTNEYLAIKRMNINLNNQLNYRGQEHFVLNGDAYLTILHKVYAQIRYQSYQNIQKRVQQKINKAMAQQSDSLSLSIIMMEDEILTEEEILVATAQNIDFDAILKRTLDLFQINYYDVDGDQNLIFEKLDYMFTQMPTGDGDNQEQQEQQRTKFEIQVLKLANINFM